MDSVHGTGVHASAAVDAGICVDDALAALLADGVDRTGILTCCAIGAIVGNSVSHGISPLKIGLPYGILVNLPQPFSKCPAKNTRHCSDKTTKYVEFI
jgi:hypothetical protein